MGVSVHGTQGLASVAMAEERCFIMVVNLAWKLLFWRHRISVAASCRKVASAAAQHQFLVCTTKVWLAVVSAGQMSDNSCGGIISSAAELSGHQTVVRLGDRPPLLSPWAEEYDNADR